MWGFKRGFQEDSQDVWQENQRSGLIRAEVQGPLLDGVLLAQRF